jgi:hypothetical protein
VALRWDTATGQTQHGVALLAEISRSGASVRAQRPVRVGTKLSLGYQNKEYAGTVKHCMRTGSDYQLGIEFGAGVEMSGETEERPQRTK